MEIFSKSPSIARAWKTASKIPASLHFRKRAYTVCHGPHLSGSSLHGAPHLASTTFHLMLCGYHILPGVRAFFPSVVLAAAYP